MAGRINITEERKANMLSVLGKKKMTANEIIGEMFRRDLLLGGADNILEKGFKHYLHLNKLFAPMVKEGDIELVGTKKDGRRPEKVWKRTLH